MNVFIRYLKEMEKPIENFTFHYMIVYPTLALKKTQNLIGFCNRYRVMQ